MKLILPTDSIYISVPANIANSAHDSYFKDHKRIVARFEKMMLNFGQKLLVKDLKAFRNLLDEYLISKENDIAFHQKHGITNFDFVLDRWRNNNLYIYSILYELYENLFLLDVTKVSKFRVIPDFSAYFKLEEVQKFALARTIFKEQYNIAELSYELLADIFPKNYFYNDYKSDNLIRKFIYLSSTEPEILIPSEAIKNEVYRQFLKKNIYSEGIPKLEEAYLNGNESIYKDFYFALKLDRYALMRNNEIDFFPKNIPDSSEDVFSLNRNTFNLTAYLK